jgi:hypothetical protein
VRARELTRGRGDAALAVRQQLVPALQQRPVTQGHLLARGGGVGPRQDGPHVQTIWGTGKPSQDRGWVWKCVTLPRSRGKTTRIAHTGRSTQRPFGYRTLHVSELGHHASTSWALCTYQWAAAQTQQQAHRWCSTLGTLQPACSTLRTWRPHKKCAHAVDRKRASLSAHKWAWRDGAG